MYKDEFRPEDLTEQQQFAYAMSDPTGSFAQLLRLTGVQQQKEFQRILQELAVTKTKLAAKEHEVQASQAKTKRAGREARLAEERLQSLRESTTFRVGRSLVRPLQTARKIVTEPHKVPKAAKRSLGLLRQSAETRIESLSGRKSHKKNLANLSSREDKTNLALEALYNNPTSANLETALKDSWYRAGEIGSALKLITDFPDLVEGMSPNGQTLAKRLRGVHNVMKGVSIPQSGGGPALTVEHGRIMYCAHSTPVFNSNGYSTRTRGLVQGLSGAGLDIAVVARPGYPWDSKADVPKPIEERYSESLDGIDYIHIPGGNLNRDGLDTYMMQAADAFVREARLQRPSIIQSASNFRTALPALIASRRLGIPFVYEVRGLWELTEASAKPGFESTERFDAMKTLESLVAMEADHVFAITDQVLEELVRRGVPRSKISVLPNAVNPRKFLPIPVDQAFAKDKGIALTSPIIGFAGSMVEYEGLDVLLDACQILEENGVEHQVVLAGSGAVESELRKKTADLGLKNVKFLGRLPQDEMVRLQSIFDIVVCPRKSQVITELVSPLKPLEAFACQTVVVLSDVAPHKDLAGENRAVLFRSEDPRSLAKKLERLLSSADLRAQYGREGRLWTVRERNWDSLGRRASDIYRKVLRSRRTSCSEARQLNEIRVAIIADEFTRTTLGGCFDLIVLSRDSWREQFLKEPVDLLFVESAWEGNGGEWTRGVGYYSQEENADIFALIDLAREFGIPTVFWNKEDPVHFARFAPTAAKFDHVFTTDANMIPKYMATLGNQNLTVSSLPFFAEPSIHNPLKCERPFHDTVAYAGTYYGERYKDRSQGLDSLLESAAGFGLEIYDRQANNPESPYRFPARYSKNVVGTLPYAEVIDAYKTHIAHLNVNSVLNSPTMFSRRVVEIPACGGIALSSFSRGIRETLGTNIANSDDPQDFKAWLHAWTTNPQERLDEIWRQMRTIYRSHTTQTAMTILCRTAGINVSGFNGAVYGINAGAQQLTVDCAKQLLAQSVRPFYVSGRNISEDACKVLEQASIEVSSDSKIVGVYEANLEALGNVTWAETRTFFEDLLLTSQFGKWSTIGILDASNYDGRSSIVRVGNSDKPVLQYQDMEVNPSEKHLGVYISGLIETRDDSQKTEIQQESLDTEDTVDLRETTILIAGHDLKFAGFLMDYWTTRGAKVNIDKWESHAKHDVEKSASLLQTADVVFCEWGLGNAVWYSQNIREDQNLIVRVHSQELFRPFLSQIHHENVDKYIFVGELIRQAAVVSHGVPEDKTVVIPNPVDFEALNLPKKPSSEFALGLVGIVPQSKRLDLALDILERLQVKDDRFYLRIKGKTPEDYPWMKNRPDEMAYYEEQSDRINHLNSLRPNSVIFDGFGADMPEWYRKVGHVLSLSDFESFHLTVADGVASGATPYILAWPGSDLIYPDFWLHSSLESIVDAILSGNNAGIRFTQRETHDLKKNSVCHAVTLEFCKDKDGD